MERKLKIAVLLGKTTSVRILDLFEPMLTNCEIKALSFLKDLTNSTFVSEIPLHSYIEDDHLGGYFRGLEEELAKVDIIIGSGMNDAVSFQAFRYAYHHKKSFYLFCMSEREIRLFEQARCDEMQDCVERATGFFVFDELSQDHLEFLGVRSERILRLNPSLLTDRFNFQPKLREKFRNYLNVESSDFFIICRDSLEISQAATDFLKVLAYWKTKNPERMQQVKVLFTGSGQGKDALKYAAVDLGLNQQTYFLNQDVQPFLVDLLSSADLQLSLIQDADRPSLQGAFDILEGLACGLTPLINERHPLAQHLESFVVSGLDFAQIYDVLNQALLAGHKSDRDRQSFKEMMATHFNAEQASVVLLGFVRTRSECVVSLQPWNSDFALVLKDLKLMQKETLELQIEKIEGYLDVWAHHADNRGQLQLLKGHVYLKFNRFEDAMNCYEHCTADEVVQRDAYMGLAHIAYLTHSGEETLSFYRKALAIKPNDPDAMRGLGLVYRKNGMNDDAVFWLGKSLSVDIDNQNTLIALTQACLGSDEVGRSITLMEQLQVLIGSHPALVMTLGQLYYRIGENQKGRELVDLALMLTDDTVGTLPA